MKKILWLASWYPNRLAPSNADFIQRHARAVSLYHEVDIIFVVRDPEGKITRNVKLELIKEGALTQQIIYYYSPKIAMASISRLLSQLKYDRLFKKYIRKYIEEKGLPSLVHVQVGMKAGLMAGWMKKKYAVPYVITEHWTGFLPEAAERFDGLSIYLQQQWKRLLANASGISAVSAYLGKHLQNLPVKMPPVKVIPNVVDTTIFYPLEKQQDKITRFIHVSGLGFQKNPEAILQAFAMVTASQQAFHLTIVGPLNDSITARVEALGLSTQVSLHHEVPQAELAKWVQSSDALVLYSRYETFGCVVAEALASGVPVIVSDIPVMHELVVQGESGILVKADDPAELANQIGWFIANRGAFNRLSIAEKSAARYNYAEVGKVFADWYEGVAFE
jgi:glycosyltransferase involved in cell wall biosynthesis